MKLINLFGVLVAISPVFAAKPGTCAGKIPSSTVEQCSDPCDFQVRRS